MDIETTKDKNNRLNAYLITAYNGINYISSYIDQELNEKLLFENFRALAPGLCHPRLNQLFTFFYKF
jgi:hypothetical protein